MVVPPGEDGSRLESFLRKRLGWPRDLALKALRKGWVRVEGKRARADRRLVAGERVKVTNYALPLEPETAAAAPLVPVPPDAARAAERSLRLVDEHLFVSAKPEGVVVHRGSGHAWGWADALALLPGGEAGFPPSPVGRLDRDTSGLLVLARSRGAARGLFDQLRDGTLYRTYQALVLGAPEGQEGAIELPLRKRRSGRQRMVVDAEEGAAARTRWRLLRRLPRASLLELELDTGRTHQIRAQLAALGHPLLGDPRYADEPARALARRLGLERLFLHAGALRFQHPVGGAPLAFDDPLPPELAATLRALESAG